MTPAKFGGQLSHRWIRIGFYIARIVGSLLLAGYGHVRFSRVLNLGGDTTQVLNFAKSYIDGFGFRYNPKLGFPGVQDNIYFPTFDFSSRSMLWIFGQFTRSAELSYHLLYVSGVALMALGAVAGLNKLGVRPWVALIGSFAFVITPFFASRVLGHDFLSLYFSAAFGGTLALLVARLPAAVRISDFMRQPFVIVAIALAATSGLYYAFFTAMFVTFGGLVNAVWQRHWRPLLLAVIIVAIITPVLVLTGYGTGIIDVIAGRIPQVVRGTVEQIGLGLNPAETVGSLATIPGLAWTMGGYKSVLPIIPGAKGLFEWPSPLLTAIIFGAPLSVALVPRGHVEKTPRWLTIHVASLFLVFGVLYAIRGGLAFFFNILVTPEIRATDRIMPFLTFFALVSACLAVELAIGSRRLWIRIALPAIVIGALGFGVWLHVGVVADKQRSVLASPVLMGSIASTRQMLLAKDASGASAVLQLPVVSWPEQPPILEFDPYSHQNAYILDRPKAVTRWSYGAAKSQPAFLIVKTLVDEHATAGLGIAAQTLGFDAILIEKKAYDADQIGRLEANIGAALAPGCRVFDDAYRVLFVLRAAADARACLP